MKSTVGPRSLAAAPGVGAVATATRVAAGSPRVVLSFPAGAHATADIIPVHTQVHRAALTIFIYITLYHVTLMLIAESLTKEYRSGERTLAVLRNVSFAVQPGELVAITGPSGSGKTTLLGLLAGLDTPSSGRVILDGADMSRMSEDERARVRSAKVGFVFQSFQLIPTLTAAENVQVPLELRGDSGAAERASELLERVGLAARGSHFPMQLSGGEQQRVAIARAFANNPSILFADEPTGNLDAASGARVVELLEDLNHESGSTVVLVTHDPMVAARGRRQIRLADGAVIEDTGAQPHPSIDVIGAASTLG
ncbi:MAG: ABC transporter ATP-binding protein [Gemmatimonadaceae bacterium]